MKSGIGWANTPHDDILVESIRVAPDFDLWPYLNRDLDHELTAICKGFAAFEPKPFAKVPEVLTPVGLDQLEELEVPVNGKCDPDVLRHHRVAGPLAETMGRISLANNYYQLKNIVASLRNETGDNLQVLPHRDLLDGHAVLYNYGVEGDLYYIINGEEQPIVSNELVILNGAYDWIDVSDYIDENPSPDFRQFGGVTALHAVEGRGFGSRDRLLVYADGRRTLTTQIPA